ncbi:hypothetical protein V8E51_014031 [Hyaloscypha variabilis]
MQARATTSETKHATTKDMDTKDVNTKDMQSKDMEHMNMEELRAVLETERARDEAVRREGELRSKLTHIEPDSATEPSICNFFDRLPRELRDRIYKYLLVNHDLSTTKFLKNWGTEEVSYDINKFELSPQILRTCRQALEEGLLILYGFNEFIIEFVTNNGKHVSINPTSPILRHSTEIEINKGPTVKLASIFPWVAKVKRWRVILPSEQYHIQTSKCAMISFAYFCRFLCSITLSSLEVLLLPRGLRVEYKPPHQRATRKGCFDVRDLLEPLTLLRNIPCLKLDELRGRELPVYDASSSEDLLTYNNIDSELKAQIVATVQGDSPVTYVFRMHQKLLDYAGAFESNSKLREAMNFSWKEVQRDRSDYRSVLWTDPLRRPHSAFDENPYKQFALHPVEGGLCDASFATQSNDVSAFRRARRAVLDYLELQYQRIVHVSRAVAEFVKALKTEGMDFSPKAEITHGSNSYLLATCLLFLEDYAKSFVRDVPPYIRVKIRRQQLRFDLIYAPLEREVLMKKKLSDALNLDILRIRPMPWKNWFKAAVDDMDKQYLRIRKFRKELFEFDPACDQDRGCGIDLELWRCDEMVDWTVNEPVLNPHSLPTAAELEEWEELRRAEAPATEDEASAAQESATTSPVQSP